LNKTQGGCTLSIEKNREYGVVDQTISFDFDPKTRVFSVSTEKPKHSSNVINFLGIKENGYSNLSTGNS
jgi:hypothetical protein